MFGLGHRASTSTLREHLNRAGSDAQVALLSQLRLQLQPLDRSRRKTT